MTMQTKFFHFITRSKVDAELDLLVEHIIITNLIEACSEANQQLLLDEELKSMLS